YLVEWAWDYRTVWRALTRPSLAHPQSNQGRVSSPRGVDDGSRGLDHCAAVIIAKTMTDPSLFFTAAHCAPGLGCSRGPKPSDERSGNLIISDTKWRSPPWQPEPDFISRIRCHTILRV